MKCQSTKKLAGICERSKAPHSALNAKATPKQTLADQAQPETCHPHAFFLGTLPVIYIVDRFWYVCLT